MPTHIEYWILEAAFRSILMAAAVWSAIRLLRVQGVLAQKLAWALVLIAAGVMPLVMRAPFPAINRAIQIPVRNLSSLTEKTSDSARIWFNSHLAGHPVAIPGADITIQLPTEQLTRTEAPSSSIATAEPLPAATPNRMPSRASNRSRALSIQNTPTSAAQTQTASAVISKSPAAFPSLGGILTILYVTICGLLFLRIALGLGIAFRIWHRARPNPELSSNTHGLRIRISPDLATPVTIGSSILLPASYRQWDQAKLRIVLAHEQSHVRQADFYLQALAAAHAAVFWFSPLGWWLQRKLSDLGEALSDRAGLEQAPDASSYAQILLEFAALPRTNPLPLAGVAMARSSNLSTRIERILNHNRFRRAFSGSLRHAVLATLLVPASLFAAVAMVRVAPAIEPAVKAAQAPNPSAKPVPTPNITPDPASIAASHTDPAINADGVAAAASDTAAPIPANAPDTGKGSSSSYSSSYSYSSSQSNPSAPEPAPQAPQAPEPPHHSSNISIYNGDHGDGFAIVHENGDHTLRMNGTYNDGLAQIRNKIHGDYIWFERNGQSYVITDPALLSQAQEMFKEDPEITRQMAELNRQQDELNKKMQALRPEMEAARLPGPEFQAEMDKLHKQLAELNSAKMKEITDKVNAENMQETLGELQEKIGDIQGQIGEIQGKIGERQGAIGEKQGAIGEQMGKIGEKMGRLGEIQGKKAEEAGRKFQPILDQAVRDGKAKPIN